MNADGDLTSSDMPECFQDDYEHERDPDYLIGFYDAGQNFAWKLQTLQHELVDNDQYPGDILGLVTLVAARLALTDPFCLTNPPGFKTKEWNDPVVLAKDGEVLAWLDARLPQCMKFVPKEERNDFLLGIYQAQSELAFG